jgi:hypothetical protein
VWELAQLPLYTIYRQSDVPALTYAVVHCTAGDVLIALATYVVAAAVSRNARWPLERPLAGLALAVTAGVAYTVVSEWRNVYRVGSWAYTETMPLIFGIGLSPLIQWVFVPALTVLSLRFLERAETRHKH